MSTLYVLLCEEDNYYVGKTYRPITIRIEEHFSTNGSVWTKKYKPLSVVEIISNADEFDEDKYTKKYMKMYGIQKVRGGSYTQLKLPDYSITALEHELCTASDLCFRCNRAGHFANKCYAKSKADGSPIVSVAAPMAPASPIPVVENAQCSFFLMALFDVAIRWLESSPSPSPNHIAPPVVPEDTPPKKTSLFCYRCKRYGHNVNSCYAVTDKSGNKL